MPEDSVKVAVRCRPFNQREKDRNAKLVIKMDGQMTSITNPEAPNEDPKKFSFDYSYWSHDGFEDKDGLLEPLPGSSYASQRRVFEDLGQGVLDNAFEGYNCSLFAYGQTGSGKSYSMVGYGSNRGIVPITCDELFKSVEGNTDSNKRFEVTFSMLEIYNEQVRDLLSKENPKGGLQVRQNPKLGLFYVENLKKVPVGSYKEIEKRMDQGTANRTVASTNMNATSSRAHTVVTITFDQIIKNESGSETKKSSVMNLVDLAGSERADSTGATGDRLKEGANINRSLSALGNVISALADLSTGSKKKIVVPYRDSVLTKLLQNALGGNSKTVMIAALSPADINYDETLSTLRYADRAKKIKNKAVVNENPMDKLIRELKEENERLKKAMLGGNLMEGSQGMSEEDIVKMRKEMEEEIRMQLLANQAMLNEADSQEDWEQKLAAARTETDAMGSSGGSHDARRKRDPYLINLNEDPMLSGVICHFLEKGSTTIGRKDAQPVPNICLNGLSIQQKHAVIYYNKNGEIEIEPNTGSGSKTKINGLPLDKRKTLCHKDRILFGSNHMYVLINPNKKDTAADNLPAEIDWDFAQKEIAQVKGFATTSLGLTKDQQIAQEQVLEILPMVSEVNAVSEELDKHKSFEVVLISAAAQEGTELSTNKETRVMVKMTNLLNNNTWLWDRSKFTNRRYIIQDLYQKYLDGDDVSKIPKEEDPFWEPAEDVLIGTANAFLQSLSYALDFDDKLIITDYKGHEEGTLNVVITPCNDKGKPLDEDSFVDDPKDLLNKPYHFMVTVKSAEITKTRFSKGVKVQYKVTLKEKKGPIQVETPVVRNSLTPEFKHSKIITIHKVTKDNLEYFESGCITFLVYGTQEDTMPDSKLSKMTTRELRQMNNMKESADTNIRRRTLFGNEIASDQSHLKAELVVLQRKYERLAQKERRLQEICNEWKAKEENEKQYEPFYRAVSAAAFSSGTRLKTRVHLLNQVLRLQKAVSQNKNMTNEKASSNQVPPSPTNPSVLKGQKYVRTANAENNENNNVKDDIHHSSNVDDDTISLFVFGEEEHELASEAEKNYGIVPYTKVAKHHYADLPLSNSKTHNLRQRESSACSSDSFSSVDLAPYMNVNPRVIRDKSVTNNHKKAKPGRHSDTSLTNNKNVGGGQKRPASAGGSKGEEGSKACVIQ